MRKGIHNPNIYTFVEETGTPWDKCAHLDKRVNEFVRGLGKSIEVTDIKFYTTPEGAFVVMVHARTTDIIPDEP